MSDVSAYPILVFPALAFTTAGYPTAVDSFAVLKTVKANSQIWLQVTTKSNRTLAVSSLSLSKNIAKIHP